MKKYVTLKIPDGVEYSPAVIKWLKHAEDEVNKQVDKEYKENMAALLRFPF